MILDNWGWGQQGKVTYELIFAFLTVAAVLVITFMPPPLWKRMKNVIKKLNWVLPNVTSKIWTKSIWTMVWALSNCFCCQKAEMNFTQSMGFAKCNFQNSDKKFSAYGVRTKQLFLQSKSRNEFYPKYGFC